MQYRCRDCKQLTSLTNKCHVCGSIYILSVNDYDREEHDDKLESASSRFRQKNERNNHRLEYVGYVVLMLVFLGILGVYASCEAFGGHQCWRIFEVFKFGRICRI